MGARERVGWPETNGTSSFDPYRRMPALLFALLRDGEQPGVVCDRIALSARLVVRDCVARVESPAHESVAVALLAEHSSAPPRPDRRPTLHWSELGLPLVAHGVHLGRLVVSRHDGAPLTHAEADALRTFAELAAVVLHDAHLRALLQRLATTDDLTGLANRRRILAELRRRAATGAVSLLFVDFDGLKSVNDGLGFDAGDELVRAVARALDESMEPGELAGRLGGDELVAVLSDTAPDAAWRRAERVEAALADLRLSPAVAERYLGASVGVATLRRGETPDDLLRRAADEMRARKRARKSDREIYATAVGSATT